MLLELNIRNIALIESLTIEFGRGFNVLTGETGAGKSIVVDSLNMALGGRTDRELIRTGAENASVQAIFDIAGNFRAIEFARELGAEIDDGIVGVSREIRTNGRNICRISGVVVPLMTLRQFTSMLVDIHGQHEHQALIDPERHREFLDAFGGELKSIVCGGAPLSPELITDFYAFGIYWFYFNVNTICQFFMCGSYSCSSEFICSYSSVL